MLNYNIEFNYFSIFILNFTLFLTGILIFKRVTSERRFELVSAAGSIFGIALFIILLNLIAHFIKGIPGFWISLGMQIFLTFCVTRFFPTSPLTFPRGKQKLLWILSLCFWGIFLYQITAHATTDGADSVLHQSFAARFIRGDYPMHQPWQPDYIAYYHFGGAELLGSFHALTGAPYYFLHPFIAFWMLLFASQILTWVFLPHQEISLRSIFIRSLPAIVGLISLGGFFIAWPAKFESPFPINQLPVLNNAFEIYGSPATLDALVFFLHRFLSICFFISLLVLLLYPNKGILAFFALAVYLGAMALADESVLIVTILPILILSFFNIFSRSFKVFTISVIMIFLIILFQGGLITEVILNRYGDSSSILIFPGDKKPLTEKYLTYRLSQQKSKLYPADDKLKTFSWFHPGILWQLMTLLIFTLILTKKSKNRDLKNLSWLLLLSSIISFIAFHGLVPKGYTHNNGNRFLALSYYLSGIGLAYLLYLPKKKYLSILIIWILLTSLIPPLIQLFPRKKDNWFIINPQPINPLIEWVKDNIPTEKRIVALEGMYPSNGVNIDLVRQAGMLTPVWAPKPRVHDSFDVGPSFADLFYSLNPEIIQTLKIDYLLINNSYFSKLPKERQTDLQNSQFFTPLFSFDNSTILQVQSKYLSEGKNFAGTFTEFDQIAPFDGAYCIDYPPNISENVYRILRLLMSNRKSYCNNGGAFYNSRIDIELNIPNEKIGQYDYLVLGKDVDPQTICHCRAKLLWTGLGNGVKFWKVEVP